MNPISNIPHLSELLSKNKKWPLQYMFKFIVPNIGNNVQTVVGLLPNHGTISYNHTPNLRYVSVTCVASMPSADSIVDITNQVTAINGVMAL
ncbi:MAG: hypothetical protein QM786_07660 [Breznakibacter sp.]